MTLLQTRHQKIWFSSDTHYNHENICKSTTSWNVDGLSEGHLGVRNFSSLEDMNNAILDGINNNVADDDILFHLGDWSFGGIESIFEFRKQIKCNNIRLIFGNHDHHIKNNRILPDNQQEEAIEWLGYKPLDGLVRTQDLFESVQDVLQIKVQLHKKQKANPIFLSHYSHRVWDKHYNGWFHAFGHSHGSLDYAPNGRSIDVGIDTANQRFGEYRPYNVSEFISICKEQDINFIDHHTKK